MSSEMPRESKSLNVQKTGEMPSKLKILVLLRLSEDQEKELEEFIQNHGGVVNIFVYPSCEETDPISGQAPDPEYFQSISEGKAEF